MVLNAFFSVWMPTRRRIMSMNRESRRTREKQKNENGERIHPIIGVGLGEFYYSQLLVIQKTPLMDSLDNLRDGREKKTSKIRKD
jgi:hypothetical protein